MSENTVTAAQIRDAIALAAPEAPISVEQTGGGTATIYVGTCTNPRPDDLRDLRFWLAVGPGVYDWREPWASDFLLDDTCIGSDDDGESPVLYFSNLEQVTAYVAGRLAGRP